MSYRFIRKAEGEDDNIPKKHVKIAQLSYYEQNTSTK